MVGSYLPDSVEKTDKETLDVTKMYFAVKKDIVIHLAAETDVDLCEIEPWRAYKTNVFGTYNVVDYAKCKVIYISTAQSPVTVYGRTKRIGEQIVRDLCSRYLIIRAGWMFGGGRERDKKFVGMVIKNKDKPFKAVSDLYGCPTYAKDLVDFIMNNLHLKGTLNFCNGVASRYEIAKYINPKTMPVSSANFPASARRQDELMQDFICPRPWQEAIDDYLKEWE